MKILFFQWNAYMQKDVEMCFRKMNIDYKTISYNFRSSEEDDYFARKFPAKLLEDHYDAVFSMNFHPFVADICYQYRVKYISWTYDSPLHFKRINTLQYETNYAFFFDKLEYERHKANGFHRVFYLPLAIPTERFDSMEITDNDREKFSSDISFVGKIYQSELSKIYDFLPARDQGFLTGICHAQQRIYGYNFIHEVITKKYLNDISAKLILKTGCVSNLLSREQMFFALCTYVTHLERMEIITRLSEELPFTLFSGNCPEEFKKVDYRGTVFYSTEMPKVFRLSRINLNITLKSIESGIPLRCMDILGCGGFLMSNYQPELLDYFINGEEIVCYESTDDLIEKCHYYLSHEEERAAIAKRGHDRAHELFNYEKQLSTIFATAELK